MIEPSDEQAAGMAQKGDLTTFEILVNRYEAKITRYGKKFLYHPDDIKDIVQEIFIKAFINIKSFDTKRRFSPWIYRVAHNEFINALKKKKSEKVSFIDFDLLFPHPVAKETADSEIERHDLRRQLDVSLKKLPMKYREPLILYYFEEMSYREIAEVMRLPVSTVGVRLQRGRERLKDELDQDKQKQYGQQQ